MDVGATIACPYRRNHEVVSTQLNIDLTGGKAGAHSPGIAAAVEKLSSASGTESRGAIFTKVEVVEFILDLLGYTENKPLHKFRLLEPSFGGGDFLLPAVGRLITAWRAAMTPVNEFEELGDAIRAVELHRETFHETRLEVIRVLRRSGIPKAIAVSLADRWLIQGDFLLEAQGGAFDFVVGNPPYVRQEMIPAPLLAEYRSRYRTMFDRADLYIPFIEKSLSLLSSGGHLGFICADRWMKNKYGGPLRQLIS